MRSESVTRAVWGTSPLAAVLAVAAVLGGAGCRTAGQPGRTGEAAPDRPPLRRLDLDGEDYRTPRAGEGFRTRVFGREVEVEPRNRRSVSAWDAGMAAVAPGVTQSEVTPFASLYFWRHPDEDSFTRAIVVGAFDDVFIARSFEGMGPFETVFTFNNLTPPVPSAETVDGVRIDEEELYWGSVQPGIGVGYRRQLTERNENMLAVSLIGEPGLLYFDSGDDTADDFVEPSDTFEGRARLRLRFDLMERNLLELAHRGVSAGGDAVYGYRSDWDDWGRRAQEDASDTRDYVAVSGYVRGASGVPFVDSERHRLILTVHGGTGDDLDRFSTFRLGGGPSGDEYDAVSRPLLPGAVIRELSADHYAIGLAEYRFEAIFFTYLSVRSSISYVDRQRLRRGRIRHDDDTLFSIGGRITTGFVFRTQLQLDYNYNFDVIRRGDRGGHEVVFHLSRAF